MKSCLILICLALSLSGFARSKNRDAERLKSQLDNTPGYEHKPDTATINHLNKLSEAYLTTNVDSAYYYGKKCVELSKKIQYASGIAGGLLQTGSVNYFKGRSAEAESDLGSALLIYKKLKDYKGLGNTYIAYARMYTLLAKYQLALKYLDSARAVNEKINDEQGLTDTYKNYGIVYYSQGKIPPALDFYYKGLYIAIKNHYTLLSSAIYNDIGVVLQSMDVYPNALDYFNKALGIVQKSDNVQIIGTINENIGEILLAQNKYDDAINHLYKALIIAKKQDDKDGLGSVYTDLGLCYAHKNQYGLAIKFLDTSAAIGKTYKFVYNQAYALIGLATVYNMQKDYTNAYKYAMQGQAFAMQLGNLEIRASAAQQLNKTLAGLGKFSEAYAMMNQYVELKNELKNNESFEKLTSFNFALDFAAKERLLMQQQQEKLRGQRLINIIFLVIIMGMVCTSVVYYRQKRKQQKINVLLEEKNNEINLQKASIDEQANKLNDLNTLKDRLISILAHDLRSPLNTLRGLFDLLQDETITHQEMIEMIPGVLKKLEYTSDFLDTLLSWVSSQMENFDNTSKTFYVKDIVSYEIDNYQEQAALKGITLIYDVPADLEAAADPNSIRIVVRNLITNAIKFSGKNDTIAVYADQSDGQNITIKVKDTGMGIAPLQLKKLFKSRVDSGMGTKNESGTGLGLLFCKDLVEKCNGTIWVTSKQGSGTEFAFTVPSNDTEILEVA